MAMTLFSAKNELDIWPRKSLRRLKFEHDFAQVLRKEHLCEIVNFLDDGDLEEVFRKEHYAGIWTFRRAGDGFD